MLLQVRVLPLAETDLRRISDSIQNRVSAKAAKNWVAKLRTAIVDLKQSAERHPEAFEATQMGRNIRMRIVGNRSHSYRILFTIDGQTVNVHRIRHAAQNSLTDDDF